MVSKKELLVDIITLVNRVDDLEEAFINLEKRVKKLEPKKERKSVKKVSK